MINIRRFLVIVFLTALYSAISAEPNTDDSLAQWASFAKTSDCGKMLSWIRSGIECEMKGGKYRDIDFTAPPYYGRLGIFITLVKDKSVRGCFGAFDHKSDSLGHTLREYIRGAISSDPRYKPLEPDELDSISVIVTIADKPFPVSDLNEIDISRYGIVITKGESSTVLVPAEMRSKDRLKPIIKGAEIFAFKAVCIKSATP